MLSCEQRIREMMTMRISTNTQHEESNGYYLAVKVAASSSMAGSLIIGSK